MNDIVTVQLSTHSCSALMWLILITQQVQVHPGTQGQTTRPTLSSQRQKSSVKTTK